MGLISAGDEREVLHGLPNVVKVVEDVLIFDATLKTYLQCVREVISRCANPGITLHLKKFSSSASEADYCGFKVTTSSDTLPVINWCSPLLSCRALLFRTRTAIRAIHPAIDRIIFPAQTVDVTNLRVCAEGFPSASLRTNPT